MPVPSPRNKILPARGTYATLAANVASLLDGEICYAVDQDQYYQNEGGTLVAVGATKAQGILADSATQPGDNISTLTNDAGYITSAGAPVQSVNSQTGVVVLDADDIDDTSTTNKFATAAELSLIGTATQPGDNISTLTNDSGYITSAGAPVQSVNSQTGTVILDADDIDDTSTTNKFATAAELSLIGTATQPGDNISTLTNDAGYITNVPDGDKGDITVSSSGTAWSIDTGAVTYAKIQDVSATDRILGRSTAGAGDIEEITCTAAGRALLDDADAAAQRTTLGLGTIATLAAPSGSVVGTTDAQTLTNKTLGDLKETVYTISDGASVDLDPVNGPIQVWTLGANRTATATNFAEGESMMLMVADGAAYTLTWPTMTWVGGSAPTLATSGYTVVELWKVGSTLYGAGVGDVA